MLDVFDDATTERWALGAPAAARTYSLAPSNTRWLWRAHSGASGAATVGQSIEANATSRHERLHPRDLREEAVHPVLSGQSIGTDLKLLPRVVYRDWLPARPSFGKMQPTGVIGLEWLVARHTR